MAEKTSVCKPRLVQGIMAIIFGGSMAVVDVLYPSKFPTILEVDYDTPYRYFVAQGNQSSRNTSAANSTTNTPLPLPRYQKMGNSNEYSERHSLYRDLGADNPPTARSTYATICGGHPSLLDDSSGPSSSGLNQLGSEDGDSITHIIDDTEDGIDNAAFEQESDDGCVMVDGKRAVTLQDFGKFADRAQSPAGSTAGSVAAKRRVLGSSIGFNVKDISIDMHTDSSKW
ncbi:hypothetical protein HPB51_020666 [Rhipicephalus microplus]|uniref:Uncharacterized protein n=1 Tax=Rhipicephalus microplus TaxID=6941 RepID=A0A9J6D755_RHIMP|nr:hypothetical protein HPB51_020666 [Rhipicephalus microplus]